METGWDKGGGKGPTTPLPRWAGDSGQWTSAGTTQFPALRSKTKQYGRSRQCVLMWLEGAKAAWLYFSVPSRRSLHPSTQENTLGQRRVGNKLPPLTLAHREDATSSQGSLGLGKPVSISSLEKGLVTITPPQSWPQLMHPSFVCLGSSCESGMTTSLGLSTRKGRVSLLTSKSGTPRGSKRS